jgi:hypothetical protein
VIAVLAGVALVALVLWETFETLVLPRRVTRRLRITRVFYRGLWGAWSAIGRRHPAGVRLDPRAAERLASFRRMYEPYVLVLSRRLEMPLPTLLPGDQGSLDDWQRSAWDLPG